MFQNLKRYFYDNKTKILRNLLVVAFFILILQGANYLVGAQSNIYNNVNTNTEFTYGNLINFGNTVNNSNSSNLNETIDKNETVSSNNTTGGTTITEENNETSTNNSSASGSEKTLNSFLDLCIEGNVEKAYELLSEECKKVLFTTLEKFQTNYYSNIFGKEKIYTVEQYYGNTYKVRIAENMASTGAYSALAYTEYITIVYNDGDIKVNVNNYIGRFDINTTSTNNNITVNVNYKDVFIDYERYNITVKNENEEIIKLNGTNGTDTMYLTDTNGKKYYAYTYEILESSLILRSGSTVDFNIKYDSSYSEYTNSKSKLVFSNIILDYDTYRKLEDKSEYENIDKIQVEI